MISNDQIDAIIGATAYGNDGDKIGSVGQVFLDDETGRPEWATVNTGLFGTNESFVPLEQASVSEGELRLPYDKQTVKDAPNVSVEAGHLSQEEEAELYRYYGLGYAGAGTAGEETRGTLAGDARGTVGSDTPGTVGYDTSGPETDDAMTRSEERLRVGKEGVETGRARLRKYVVTEQETVSVPVTREEVRVEREPITDSNVGAALDGPAISEEEHEVVLHEERPVVAKEAVPVERVRLSKETVTDQETVTEDVRKEHIEEDVDSSARTDRTL